MKHRNELTPEELVKKEKIAWKEFKTADFSAFEAENTAKKLLKRRNKLCAKWGILRTEMRKRNLIEEN